MLQKPKPITTWDLWENPVNDQKLMNKLPTTRCRISEPYVVSMKACKKFPQHQVKYNSEYLPWSAFLVFRCSISSWISQSLTFVQPQNDERNIIWGCSAIPTAAKHEKNYPCSLLVLLQRCVFRTAQGLRRMFPTDHITEKSWKEPAAFVRPFSCDI